MKFVLTIVIAAGILACRGSDPVVNADDPGLSAEQGRQLYNGKPFTGFIRNHLRAIKEIHKTHYRAGFQHGLSTEETEGGLLLASRNYEAGAKHGVHRTWHQNGKQRSYAEFRLGKYTGEVWLWHDNGLPYDYSVYDENGLILVQKRWRVTGQIYMNQVFQNGTPIGMPGSKLCNPAKTEEKSE